MTVMLMMQIMQTMQLSLMQLYLKLDVSVTEPSISISNFTVLEIRVRLKEKGQIRYVG